MNSIKVDFTEKTGVIKPLHGVCCAPYSHGMGSEQRYINRFFTEARIPFCRLHDCCGPYGGTYFVDITNVFPDFDADENDPSSYEFHYTDEYIGAIQASGCETYYRLGETIEWGSKKYRTLVPKDMEKWARICEHIIRHYNEGWAEGFHYNIKYWEIWNEPENPGSKTGLCMWNGTKEEFFELYKVSAKYLRKCFPNIKLGGYGGCGFYAITRENMPQSFKDFVPYFTDFLQMVKEEGCPLDFFSWHIYTLDHKELMTHAKYVRETLDEYGFKDTESHLNEWNISDEGTGFNVKHTSKAAAFLTSVMCMAQNTNYLDMAMYYCFSLMGIYNGFLDQNDRAVNPPWYSMVAFGELYRLGTAVKADVNEEGIQATAATGEEGKAVILSNYECEDEDVTLSLNMEKEGVLKILRVDEKKCLEEEIEVTVPKVAEVKIKVPENTFALVKIENK